MPLRQPEWGICGTDESATHVLSEDNLLTDVATTRLLKCWIQI